MEEQNISEILAENIGKNCTIFTDQNYRYYCRILRVFQDFVEFLDLKKGFTKIMKLNSIKEVDFALT